MLEDDERDIGPGGVFAVDSVDAFFEETRETYRFLKEPVDIPPGRYAIYQDADGNPIRIIDLSKK